MAYKISEELEDIALEVIEENSHLFEHLLDPDCRIAYQFCTKEKKSKGMTVYADTEKISDKHKELMPYDFLITFYLDSADIDPEHLKRLMFHELLHVGFDPGQKAYSIIPHDLEDFRACIDRWGADWARK